jgi:hypothetical protein
LCRRLPDTAIAASGSRWPLKLAASLAALRGARVGDVKLPTLVTMQSDGEVEEWLA